jgi:hypothetical protein
LRYRSERRVRRSGGHPLPPVAAPLYGGSGGETLLGGGSEGREVVSQPTSGRGALRYRGALLVRRSPFERSTSPPT